MKHTLSEGRAPAACLDHHFEAWGRVHTRERGRVPSGLPGKRRAVRFRRRSSRWWFSRLLHGQVSLALEAVRTVHIEDGGRKEIDIKR